MTTGLLIGTAALTALACAAAAGGEYDPPTVIQPMLKIEWREGPEYPMGIQDSTMGILGGQVISAAGFTRHPKNIAKAYADAFGGEASGFTKLTLALEMANEAGGWRRLPDYAGAARQGAIPAVVGNTLYAFGGFSYTDPFTYRDGYRLRRIAGKWEWERLPCELPWPLYGATAAVAGNRIYLVCGGDYFQAPDATGPDFHTEAGRNGDPVGRALLVLDTRDLAAGWKRLAGLPGTPRMTAACGIAGGKVYVLGGTYAPVKKAENAYFNVSDCWQYDLKADTWTRLGDLPHGANRNAVVWRNRYLVLTGGYKYPRTWRPDGTSVEVYTPEEKARDWKAFFQDTVLVYDTRTGTLGSADPLPDRSSWPLAAISGDTVYTLGGEGGRRMWHPATFQIGRIRRVGAPTAGRVDPDR